MFISMSKTPTHTHTLLFTNEMTQYMHTNPQSVTIHEGCSVFHNDLCLAFLKSGEAIETLKPAYVSDLVIEFKYTHIRELCHCTVDLQWLEH